MKTVTVYYEIITDDEQETTTKGRKGVLEGPEGYDIPSETVAFRDPLGNLAVFLREDLWED
jgi:hypothetical protein